MEWKSGRACSLKYHAKVLSQHNACRWPNIVICSLRKPNTTIVGGYYGSAWCPVCGPTWRRNNLTNSSDRCRGPMLDPVFRNKWTNMKCFLLTIGVYFSKVSLWITSAIGTSTFWEYPRPPPYEQIQDIIQVTPLLVLRKTMEHLEMWIRENLSQ